MWPLAREIIIMKDNQKVVTIGGKDIVVTDGSLNQSPVVINGDESWFCEPKYLKPGYYDDYEDEAEFSCQNFETQETWDQNYEGLILPAAVNILRDANASSQFKDVSEFIKATLEFVTDRISIKRLRWHKRWVEDKGFYNLLRQQLTSCILVDEKYELKYVPIIVHVYSGGCQRCDLTYEEDICWGCSDCGEYCDCADSGSCKNLTKYNAVVPVESASTLLLEEAVLDCSARNPQVERWSVEFRSELANDIELDLAEDYLTGNGPGIKQFN